VRVPTAHGRGDSDATSCVAADPGAPALVQQVSPDSTTTSTTSTTTTTAPGGGTTTVPGGGTGTPTTQPAPGPIDPDTGLPVTGGSSRSPLVVGVVAILLGGALLAARRRPREVDGHAS